MRRKRFEYIPFLFITPFLILGIIFGYYCQSWIYFSILIAVSLLFALSIGKLSGINEGYIACLFLTLGFVLITKDKPVSDLKYDYKTHYITKILSPPLQKGRYYRAEGEVIAKKNNNIWLSSKNKVQLNIDTSQNFNLSDVITYQSKSYGYDSVYKNYYNDKGIFARQYIYKIDVIDSTESIQGDLAKFRWRISDRITNVDTSHLQATAIMSSVTVGDKTELDRNTKNDYRVAGVSHLLAISGLHVGILYTILSFTLGWLQRIKWGRYINMVIMLLTLWAYAAISGFSPSVLRAVIMFSLFSLGECMFERKNSFNILLASAFIILVVDPMLLFDIGFQLSYCAMIGIVTLYSPIRYLWLPKHAVLKWAWSLFIITFTAQVATTPLVLYYFNQVGLLGFVTNYIVWFTIPVIITATLIFIITNLHFVGMIGAYGAEFQNFIIHSLAQTKFGLIEVKPFSKIWLIIIYAVLISLSISVVYIQNRRINRDVTRLFRPVSTKNG